ncbi:MULTISPECIES: hypothetical protein [unclassified Nonomuraea]|uniref:hypothetical protein n=1 Tax=unclassified Nonomuraea TaxID=2593643 RepID=UPI0033E5C12C
MTHLTATATTTTATVIVAALILLWLLGYAAACAADPFARCRRCHGVGKTLKTNGSVGRWCRRCDATGLRLRLGRRLYNYLRHLSRDISR